MSLNPSAQPNLANSPLDLASKESLKGLDLANANLNQANFSGADLSEVNFSKARLNAANFSQAKLTHANLHGADLCYANLSNADLTNTDLRGALLLGANLTGAKLDGADLRWAVLTNAIAGDVDFSCARVERTIRPDGRPSEWLSYSDSSVALGAIGAIAHVDQSGIADFGLETDH